MKEKFKKFCGHLEEDAQASENINPFSKIRLDYSENRIDFYDFINSMHRYNSLIYQFANYLPYTGIEKIEIFENNVMFTCKENSIKLVFNGKDRRGVPFELLNWGTYEKNEIELFDQLLEDNMSILDIGANIGWYTLVWGKKFANAKIYSFEPIRETYNNLVANVVINGLKNVHLFNFGLADANEDKLFSFYPEGACLASMQNVLDYHGAKQEKCLLRTLDSFCNEHSLKKIDAIKCDVEGAELNFVHGAQEIIKLCLPIISLELFHEWSKSFGYHPDEVILLMQSMGYRAFLPASDGIEEVESYMTSSYDRQNYFFLHNKKHLDLILKLAKK